MGHVKLVDSSPPDESDETRPDEGPRFVVPAQIWDLNSEDYQLTETVLVSVEDWGDEVVATLPDLQLYGSDMTPALALLGLKQAIVEFFESFEHVDPSTLGRPLRYNVQKVQRLVRKVTG